MGNRFETLEDSRRSRSYWEFKICDDVMEGNLGAAKASIREFIQKIAAGEIEGCALSWDRMRVIDIEEQK